MSAAAMCVAVQSAAAAAAAETAAIADQDLPRMDWNWRVRTSGSLRISGRGFPGLWAETSTGTVFVVVAVLYKTIGTAQVSVASAVV